MKYLTTPEAVAEIYNILIDAEEGIVLCSPYIDMDKLQIAAIKDAAKRKIPVLIMCRYNDIKNKKNTNPEKLSWIPKDSKYIQVRNLQGSHSKIYFNEKMLVSGSLNLTQYSYHNNEENCSLMKKEEDLEGYISLVKQYQRMLRKSEYVFGGNFTLFDSVSVSETTKKTVPSSETVVTKKAISQETTTAKTSNNKNKSSMDKVKELTKEPKDAPKILTRKPRKGFCMDCGSEMNFDSKMPSCCNRIFWEHSLFADYNEPQDKGFCHICGKKCHPTFNMPLCPSCKKLYKKWFD